MTFCSDLFSLFPSPYLLNIYFLHFSPPLPSLRLFQKGRNCASLTQFFCMKTAFLEGIKILNEPGYSSCAQSHERRKL